MGEGSCGRDRWLRKKNDVLCWESEKFAICHVGGWLHFSFTFSPLQITSLQILSLMSFCAVSLLSSAPPPVLPSLSASLTGRLFLELRLLQRPHSELSLPLMRRWDCPTLSNQLMLPRGNTDSFQSCIPFIIGSTPYSLLAHPCPLCSPRSPVHVVGSEGSSLILMEWPQSLSLPFEEMKKRTYAQNKAVLPPV